MSWPAWQSATPRPVTCEHRVPPGRVHPLHQGGDVTAETLEADPDLDELLSPKQLQAIRESVAKVNIWDGAVRSGKTMSSLLRWLIYVATAPTGGALIMVGRTRDTLARNVWGPLADFELFGLHHRDVRYTPGSPYGYLLGRKIECIGANDAQAEAKIRGLTCAGAYLDELTVLPEPFFTQTLARLSIPGSMLFGTTNPDAPAHWLKARYLDRLDKLPHWAYWHFTMDDNPTLTESYKLQRRAEFTGLWFRRFILGEWVAAEGAIYTSWDRDRHVVPWETLPPMLALLAVGMDYGTTNPSAALLLGAGVDGRLYLVDEWGTPGRRGESGTELTDAEQSTLLRAWLEQPHLPTEHHLATVGHSAAREQELLDLAGPPRLFIDPAAASMQTQLVRDGVRGLQHADNDVTYGIKLISSLLGADKLRVSSRCAGWISEVDGYAWDDKAAKAGLDKPIKVADHYLDAGRYAIASTESIWAGLVRQ